MNTFARKIWFDAMNSFGDSVLAPAATLANLPVDASGLAQCARGALPLVDCPAYLRELNDGQRAAPAAMF
jgi:hypothetical protein